MIVVKRFVLTLLVYVMATTAHAGGLKLPFMQCGLQLGGMTKVQKAYSEPKNSRQFGTQQVDKSIHSNEFGVNTFTTATSKPAGRRRLPPTFKLAKVRCSWR